MPFKSAWKLSVVQAKVADEIISRVFEPISSTISKQLKMDTRRSEVFFSVGEAATSKWTHGKVAVFGSTVYQIFLLKCQKLRTPLASLAPCVINIRYHHYHQHIHKHPYYFKHLHYFEFEQQLNVSEEFERQLLDSSWMRYVTQCTHSICFVKSLKRYLVLMLSMFYWIMYFSLAKCFC